MRTDPAAFMAKNFKCVPPGAVEAFNAANVARAQAPERTVPMPTLPAVAPELRERSRFASDLQAFPDGEYAEAALYSFRAGMARFGDNVDKRAERYLREAGLQPMAISTTGDATHGGYRVNEPVSAAIIRRLAAVGVANRIATVYPMTADKLTVPVEASGLTVYYRTETEALTESDFVFGTANFSAHKRTVFAKVSNELNDDAVISWLDMFATRAAYALASARDNELVNADGTSTYGGEVGLLASLGSAGVSTAATGHDTWPELTIADFTAAMGKLPSDYAHGGEEWLCSPQFYAIGMLGAAGGNSQGFTLDGRPLFLGKPVNLTTKMPTTTAAATVCCLYGSFKEAVGIGDRGISYAASNSAFGAFDRDIVFLKASSRYDINVFAGGDGSTAGAYVGLATAS